MARTVSISDEERDAREAIGQTRDESRTIPAPTMVLFTGESQMMVDEIAELCGIPPQEVVAVALQDFYAKILKRAEDGGGSAGDEKPADKDPGSRGSFSPW